MEINEPHFIDFLDLTYLSDGGQLGVLSVELDRFDLFVQVLPPRLAGVRIRRVAGLSGLGLVSDLLGLPAHGG